MKQCDGGDKTIPRVKFTSYPAPICSKKRAPPLPAAKVDINASMIKNSIIQYRFFWNGPFCMISYFYIVARRWFEGGRRRMPSSFQQKHQHPSPLFTCIHLRSQITCLDQNRWLISKKAKNIQMSADFPPADIHVWPVKSFVSALFPTLFNLVSQHPIPYDKHDNKSLNNQVDTWL